MIQDMTAFPVISDRGERLENSPGMTLRDYFAAKVLQALIKSGTTLAIQTTAR